MRQLKKEDLSLIFGMKKFHVFVREIIHPDNSIPALAAARMQRWSVILSAYDYTMYDHANAEVVHAGRCIG